MLADEVRQRVGGQQPAGRGESLVEAGMRTCVVCRSERPARSLLRITRLADGRGQLEAPSGRPARQGRGAWVCVEAACLGALSSRELSAAFRAATVLAGDAIAALCELARLRVMQTLGLAKRAGSLDVGAEAAAAFRTAPVSGVTLLAADAAPRHFAALPGGHVLGTMGELGQAIGQKPVAVLRVRPGHFAETTLFWLAVLAAAEGVVRS